VFQNAPFQGTDGGVGVSFAFLPPSVGLFTRLHTAQAIIGETRISPRVRQCGGGEGRDELPTSPSLSFKLA
jgi:hypothetical protein